GNITLTVSAVARDAAGGDAALTTTAFGLTVAFGPAPTPPPEATAVAGLPAMPAPIATPVDVTAAAAPVVADAVDAADAANAADAGVGGDRTIALDIDVGLSEDDVPGPISVAIGGVPAGATLSAGTDMGGGTWILDLAALAGLTLSLPADAPDQLALGVAATAADGTSATGVLTLTVSELPDFEPEPEPAIAPEPEPEAMLEPAIEPEPQPEPAFKAEAAPEPLPQPGADVAASPDAYLPVAYWKLDELLPGKVGDEMANHHGRSHGVADGVGGGAFDTVDTFDGIDDYIEVPHARDLAPDEGTLTAWFSAFATSQGTIAAKGVHAAGPHMALSIASRRLRFVIGADAVVHVAEGGVFGATEWNQATITWGAAGMALYLNGEPVATDDHADGLVGNRSRWMFGAADTGDGVGDFFHGELDDIALYGEQLAAAAVRRLFQVGVIGMMDGEGAAINEPGSEAGGDSPLDLDAIPAEDVGPASLAILDVADDLVEAIEDAKPADDVGPADDTAAPKIAASDGDSPLDLDAIPVETEGPKSLAILDAEDEDADDADTGAETIAATEIELEPAEIGAGTDEGVFVFGAGGDYFLGGDGWSDAVRQPPADDAPAVSVVAGEELKLTGGNKLEW
ncbi:MAG TPA: LamG-like jellyroll fold domain-containing protein, partial [Rhodospirillales bacterium]